MNKSPDQGVGFDWFVTRSYENQSGSDENYRLGFEGRHRDLEIPTYSKYISSTVFEYSEPQRGNVMLDIGAGGGVLSKLLEEECLKVNVDYVMSDSEEILKYGFKPRNPSIFGQFPNNLDLIKSSKHVNKIQYIIANSVLHYVKNDLILDSFLKSIADLLGIGGVAFLGDVPVAEMKLSQSYANGKLLQSGAINDFTWRNFLEMATNLSEQGCSLFVMPQPRWVPMHPHRADLLIVKHKPLESW